MFLDVTPESTGSPIRVIDDQFVLPGPERMLWDGRLPDGSFLEEPFAWQFHGKRLDRDNYFLVADSEPRAVPPDPPSVSIKSNPFLVYHSYEAVAEIVFRVNRDANVRVAMLPPGVFDPADPAAIELLPMQLLAAEDGAGSPVDHSVTWLGHEASLPEDANDVLLSGEGVATFAIEAEDPANPALRTVYRGALQVRR